MSEKRMDKKNRWRNKMIAFRGSPQEAEALERRWRLCGYATKQDYLIDSVLYQKVEAKGNPMMLVSFRDALKDIRKRLMEIETASELDDELQEAIRTMLEILEAFKENEEKQKDDNKKDKYLERRKYRNV